jgi:MerR family transcriptional regulator, light-induced transcriptional regulator
MPVLQANPRSREEHDAMTLDPPGAISRRNADEQYDALVRRFGQALRAADGRGAEAIAREAMRNGLTVAGVHTRVVAPAMYWIGELWERNLITVAEEHLATAIAHRVIAAIYLSTGIVPPVSRETVVLAAPAGQHHGLGLRMAADVLETAGFAVIYLGTDVPADALAAAVAEHQPAVVGLSLTMQWGADAATQAMAAVTGAAPDAVVIVGGQGVAPQWIEDGVGYVETVESLVAEVERLLGGADQPVWRPRREIPSLPAAPTVDTMAGVRTTEDRMLDATIEMGQLVRDQARLAARFRALAFHDHLCGLPNRRAFDDRFADLTDGEPPVDLALMLLDIDGFKQINDRFGHEEGDRTLQLIAEVLGEHLRGSDLAARLGGDEFAVLLPAISPDDAGRLAIDLQQRITARGGETDLTVSVGIAWFVGDRRRTMLQADGALYRAKSGGGNDVCMIEPGSV